MSLFSNLLRVHAVIGLLVLVTALPLAAATIVVDGTGGGDVLTIQAGIDAAVAGDLVLVRPGVYSGPGNVALDFGGKAISVVSEAGAAVTVIDCGGTERALHFHSGEGHDSVFRGFTVTGGAAALGGAILCQNASPTVALCQLTDCYASNAGGAAGCTNSAAVFDRVLISNCHTSPFGNGGGMALDRSDVALADVSITGCTAWHGGGGLYCTASSPVLTRCAIIRNTAHNNGGGLHLTEDSSPLVEACTISGNSSDDDGAAVYCHDRSSPQLLGCRLERNAAGRYGGGVFCDQGSAPLIRHNQIINNSAWSGGGLECYTDSSPRVVGNLIQGNETETGGGGISCYRTRQAVITGNRIEENIASDAGGVAVDRCSPLFTDNIIRGNAVEWSAAGLLFTRESTAVVVNNLIVDNHAGYHGGGLYVTRESNPVLINLTVAGNVAEEDGGGCYFSRAAGEPVLLENCIVYGNQALGSGGQINVSGNGAIRVSHTDLQGGQQQIGGTGDVDWGAGNIDGDPLWVATTGEYYLAQQFTGHPQDSPCLDTGAGPADQVCFIGLDGQTCLDQRTTRLDGAGDAGDADMGFHHASRIATIDCSLRCSPESGVAPFPWRISVGLRNLRPAPRRAAARADLQFPGGGAWENWRSGFFDLKADDATSVSWSVSVPALPTLFGELRLDLTVSDVTSPPWNQPPFTPAGQEIEAGCSVDVAAP